MKTKRILIVLLACLTILIAISGCSQQAPVSSSQPSTTAPAAANTSISVPVSTAATGTTSQALTPVQIPIGMTLFVTGPYASIGINLQRIAQMTIDDINQKGFVVGDKLATFKPIIGDSGMDAATGAQIAQQQILQDKVKFEYAIATNVVGTVQPITEQNGVLLLAGSGSKDYFGPTKPLTFSNTGDIYASVAGLLMYVQQQYPDLKNVWIEDSDQEATREIGENGYKPTLKYLGYNLVGSEYYPVTTNDFYSTIDKILAAKPDIVISAVAGPGVILDKQLRERGYNGLIITATSSPATNFVTAVGGADAATNILATGVNEQADILPPAVKDFVARYKAKYGEDPMGSNMYILDMFNALAQAISQAGTYDNPQQVAKVMATSQFNGPFGVVKYSGADVYGSNCMASPPIFINTWENGNFVTKQIINSVQAEDLAVKVEASKNN